MNQQLTAPKTGDKFDAEGFRIATTIETIAAHEGEWAAIVLPGMSYATNVSVRKLTARVYEISRDGKGDTLLVSLDPFMTQLITYVTADTIAGGMTFEGETGLIYEQNNWSNTRPYSSLLHALVLAAGMFLV